VGTATVLDFSNAYANGRRLELMTKFTDAEFWEITEYEFVEGKAFNASNITSGDRVAVITEKLKREYFDDPDQTAIGKMIEVDNVRYRVIGVVRGAPVTRPYTAADIYFPYNSPKSAYQSKSFQGRFIALVLAKSPDDFAAIKEEYQQAIGRIPLPQESDGFTFNYIKSEANTYLESWLSLFIKRDAGTIFYSVIALFMLLFMALPALNLVNINVSRIMERASEIGIRKAFGAPAKTLVWQFIIENLFITLIGGFIAIVLSGITIAFINASGWIAHADLTINFSVFIISLGVCLTFSLLSGVAPALRMSRVSIAEALKAA
jgi:putative ABC transport system permease protein